MNSIENNVCEAIEILAEKIIDNANYDKTIQAQIVSCIDQEAGKYKIKYQNSYSYAYATSPEIHYSNGTYVYVQVPNGDMKKNKTILNAIENSKVDYGVAIDLEDEYDKIGVNCISSDQYPFKLSSYHLEKKIIYDSKSNKNDINIDINNFASNIMYADSFLCAATIRTSFKNSQIQGNYGIGFIFDLIDPEDENKTISKIFELNVNNMQGNPYSYLNDTRQYQIFNIDGAKFKQINQVYIFIENFTTEQKDPLKLTNDDYEVFISNLELQATNRMSEDEINGYALRVIAQDGNIFYTGEEDTSQRHFISYLKYRGTVIDPSNIKFYWFRENSKVFSNNKKFNQYGGIGWECLNEKTDEIIPNWIAANEKFAIKKSLVTAAEMNFKCVAVYKDNQISKEFKLQNLDDTVPKIELSINRNDGTIEKDIVTFENGVGSPTITCTVVKTDEKFNPSDYSYRWTQEDASGTITNLIYDEEENFNAFVTIYDIQKYWEANNKNPNYNKASSKDKDLFNEMSGYLSQYEKCSLDFDSMKKTTSISDIGNKFNETIETLKSLGYRTFVSYNINLYEEYKSILNILCHNIGTITNDNNYSSWEKLQDKEESITLDDILYNIKKLSMESIKTIEKDDGSIEYYPEKYNYWNYIKEYYNNFNILLSSFLSANTDEKRNRIDGLKNNYDKLNIELSQRTLDYYGNKIYNFKVSEIYNFCTIKCAVTKIANDTYVGTSSIKIVNKIERNVGTLMLKDGNQLFQYNESGISPADASNTNPITLTPLSFSLYTKTGELVPPNIIISNGSIEWKVPAENTLIEVEEEKDEERIENDTLYHIYKNISSLAYRIKQIYSFSTYNQIELVVTYNNTIYSAKTNFTFLKQGEIGSSGTQYNCRIVPNTNMQNIPQYPILTKVEGEPIGYFNFTYDGENQWKIGDNTTSTEGIRDSFPFKVEIYESNQKTYASYLSGETSDKTINYDIQWEFLSNTYGAETIDISDFKIKTNDNKPYLCLNINGDSEYKELYSFKNKDSGFGAANILKCTITRSRKKEEEETVDVFYATLPIVTVVIENKNKNEIKNPIINIKNGTGYQFVQYSSGGLNPQYNDLIPFELEVYDDNTNDITETLNYNWKTIGQIQIYDNENKEFKTINDTSFNIIEVEDEQENGQENIIPYKIKAQAYQSYNGLNVTNGISCLIKENKEDKDDKEDKDNNEYIAFINIPIHCYLNRYAFANLNVWDGNSIKIDENGGYILTPQIGAGHKDNNNTFTGLLMGDIKESSWTEKQTGLFGYNQGERTLFLDASDGTALFGAGNGQIAIASGAKTWIYSKNFWKEKWFDKKGKLANKVEDDSNKNNPRYANKEGLLIDLEKPSIVYGNGKFRVNSNGQLIARDMILSDGQIKCGNGFSVDKYGNLTANKATLTQANVSGSVNATLFNFKDFNNNIISSITSKGFFIKGKRPNRTKYEDMGFIGHNSALDNDNVLGMTIGLDPTNNSYIALGVWDKKKKAYTSKICWSSKNGLYDKQGVYISDTCNISGACHISGVCYMNEGCRISKDIRVYWGEKELQSLQGHMSFRIGDTYMHFVNGILIDINKYEKFAGGVTFS